MNHTKINTLFLDIGGILLNNGWGHETREKLCAFFNLETTVFNERHKITVETYEAGKLTLDAYLNFVVFNEARSFTKEDFIKLMFKQSRAFYETIDFFKKIKTIYRLKIIALSNEGRELNAYRIKEFKLDELFDAYICSSFVHLRKPDPEIFQVAKDVAQSTPEQSLYIDDRLIFLEVAKSMGMNGVHYQDLISTKNELSKYGLVAQDQ